MARCRQPVTDNRSYRPPSLATSAVVCARFAGDKQDDLELLGNSLIERTVQTGVSACQIGIVQVDTDVGNYSAAIDAAVPMAVKIMRNR